MKTREQQKRDEDWSTLNGQVVGGESLPPAPCSAALIVERMKRVEDALIALAETTGLGEPLACEAATIATAFQNRRIALVKMMRQNRSICKREYDAKRKN